MTSTSSESSCTWATVTCGLALVRWVTAARTVIVFVPESVDQLASSPPDISRSSERGYPDPLVVAPPALAWKTIPSPAPSTVKYGASEYDDSCGCVISCALLEPGFATGRVSFQLARLSTWAGIRATG